ncbi:MAG: hypothetical protein HGA44_01885 [Cellulomonadaceae bacterium]|nr:hypothetical protein [Cellulomonadaceae bacterium]
MGIVPHGDCVTRLVGAIPAEQHDEWTEERRHFALDVLHRARLNLIITEPDPHEQPPALSA